MEGAPCYMVLTHGAVSSMQSLRSGVVLEPCQSLFILPLRTQGGIIIVAETRTLVWNGNIQYHGMHQMEVTNATLLLCGLCLGACDCM